MDRSVRREAERVLALANVERRAPLSNLSPSDGTWRREKLGAAVDA